VFHHVTIHAADREASERFYETVLATIEIGRTGRDGTRAEWLDFWVADADAEHPATRGLHLGFVAPSRAHVDEFWRVGTEAGYRNDGAPGPRPEYGPDYYGSFLLDPDGNSAEALHHDSLREGGAVDHLWIRVAELEASRLFYETIAPKGGFRLSRDLPERAQFKGRSGSFSVVLGRPTENAHLAFPATGESESVIDPDGNTVELVGLSPA
jgi:catechol 2,3-dioxygenase-like lactoylglutathione lyase family enzyme